jgi:membrane dipeptidase
MTQHIIIDAHLDLAWNALQWNRDITQSVFTIRTQEADQPGKGRAQNTVALPEMREAKMAVCFATLMGRSTGIPTAHVDYRSPIQTYGIAQGHLAFYRGLASRGLVRIISDSDGLEQHLSEWEHAETGETVPLGFVISMESADGILHPAQLSEWVVAGVRVIGPAHYGPGRYAGGTGVEAGFSEIGFELLREMQQHNIILDLTHLTDRAFWQAMESFEGHVLASHNNCRTLVPHQRQFDDRQIKAIIERDGVIGAAFDNWMLEPTWVKGAATNAKVTLSTVVEHIDYICQLAGNTRHVGIGSDLDGGFGREQSPADLNTIADLQQFTPLLAERGYSEDDIKAILHGNWIRKLKQAWQ